MPCSAKHHANKMWYYRTILDRSLTSRAFHHHKLSHMLLYNWWASPLQFGGGRVLKSLARIVNWRHNPAINYGIIRRCQEEAPFLFKLLSRPRVKHPIYRAIGIHKKANFHRIVIDVKTMRLVDSWCARVSSPTFYHNAITECVFFA